MNQKILHKVFIWGFLFLYLLVALISFCHAVQFFGIGNVEWMSIILAFSFELGLALSLASILLSSENKKHTLPWILMVVLTFVQCVGNVYSVFKYISLSNDDYYQYLAKPLLFFLEEVDENTIQVIVSWIMGAILPIVALMMTDMVASNIKNASTDENTEALSDPEEKSEQEFEEGNIPAFSTVEDTPTPVQTSVVPKQPEVKKEVESKKEEVKKEEPKKEEHEETIADYIDVLDKHKEEKSVEQSKSNEPNKASFLNILPKNLFKKREASEGYFKDPIVNSKEERK